MLFNSWAFIFGFMPIVLPVFFILGRYTQDGARFFLALASIAFYAWWSVAYVPLLLFSIGFNFSVARAMLHARGPARAKRSKALLIAGITGNLALLAYFKYANFFVANADELTGMAWAVPHIILPLGISFFTFTQIAFLADMAKGEARLDGLTSYTLFVTYFPHLLAGPIIHHKQVMPQFRRRQTFVFSYRNCETGLLLFVIGLTKKLLIADTVAPVAQTYFSSSAAMPMTVAWFGTLAYTMQIYFDFSGYSDMAIGLSRLFGIRLPVNFNSPYKARSIIEFWRRWHMTLSAFLRDYLYIPLGGNRKGPTRRYANLMITMLLGGFWHGAGWTYIIWGGLHGLYLMANHLLRAFIPVRTKGPAMAFLGWLLTFLAVTVAWVFFRAPNVDFALQTIGGLFGAHGTGLHGLHPDFGQLPGLFSRNRFAAVAGAVLIAWLAPNSRQLTAAYYGAAARMRSGFVKYSLRGFSPGLRRAACPTIIAGALAGALFFLCVCRMSHVSEFLYYQF